MIEWVNGSWKERQDEARLKVLRFSASETGLKYIATVDRRFAMCLMD
jgi:hypothetical protein